MTRFRPAVAPVLVAGAALVLAGCGGTTGTASSSSTPSSPPTTVAPASASKGPSAGSASPGGALQGQFVKVVHRVRPSVVQITTKAGLGSGVVYDTKGDIVTNDHVVGNAHKVTVQFPVNGQRLPATVVGTYAPDDLAVVRVHGAKALHPAPFANSSKLSVGDIVLAIGNPLAYSSSVTNGIISATNRTVVEPHHGRSPGGTIVHALQTSAPINPGNSGGALVDLGGKVVGIPTLAAVDPKIGGAAVGIGFAIPANTVTTIANQLIAHGHVVNSHRADLGIYAFQATNASGHPAGIGVAKLTSPSPAGKAGIRPGDVIVAINGARVRTVGGLQKALGGLRPGQHARVTFVQPSGAKRTVTVTLGTLPGTPGASRGGG